MSLTTPEELQLLVDAVDAAEIQVAAALGHGPSGWDPSLRDWHFSFCAQVMIEMGRVGLIDRDAAREFVARGAILPDLSAPMSEGEA